MALGVAGLLWAKFHHRALAAYLAFGLCVLCIGGVQFMASLLEPRWGVEGLSHATSAKLFLLSGPLVVAAMGLSLVWLVRELMEWRPGKFLRWTLLLPLPAALVGLGLQLGQWKTPLAMLEFTGRLMAWGYGWFFLVLLGCASLIARRFRRIEHRDVRLALASMGALMLIFLVFWGLSLLQWVPDPHLLGPYLCFLLWNLVSMGLGFHAFFRPEQSVPPRPASTSDALLAPECLDRFVAAFKLTPRERELCLLLAEDLNHAAIATRLFISEKTVRNHVSNIYAKTGTSSRLELIHRIRAA